MEIGVVEVELANAAIEVLNLSGDGGRLLPLRKYGRGLGLARWRRKGAFLAAGEAAEKDERNGEPGLHGSSMTFRRSRPLNSALAQAVSRLRSANRADGSSAWK